MRDIGFWRPSWILLEEVEKRKKNSQGKGCIAILPNFDAGQNEQN